MCACSFSVQSCVAQLLVSVVGLCGARGQRDHACAFQRAKMALQWQLLRLKWQLYNSYRKCTCWRGDVCYHCNRIDPKSNWAVACRGYVWAIRHAKAGCKGSNSVSCMRMAKFGCGNVAQQPPHSFSSLHVLSRGAVQTIHTAVFFDCLTAVMYSALIL